MARQLTGTPPPKSAAGIQTGSLSIPPPRIVAASGKTGGHIAGGITGQANSAMARRQPGPSPPKLAADTRTGPCLTPSTPRLAASGSQDIYGAGDGMPTASWAMARQLTGTPPPKSAVDIQTGP